MHACQSACRSGSQHSKGEGVRKGGGDGHHDLAQGAVALGARDGPGEQLDGDEAVAFAVGEQPRVRRRPLAQQPDGAVRGLQYHWASCRVSLV